MANSKNVKRVTLGQTRNLVSIRLYVASKHVPYNRIVYPCDAALRGRGVVWMLLEIEKPALGFA